MKKIISILFLIITSFSSFGKENIDTSKVLKDFGNPKIDFIKKYSNDILDKNKIIFLDQMFKLETENFIAWKYLFNNGTFGIYNFKKEQITSKENLILLYLNGFAAENLDVALKIKENLEFIFTSFFETNNNTKVYIHSSTETTSIFLIEKNGTQLILHVNIRLNDNIPSVWIELIRIIEPIKL